ncbi:hypothetical protein PWT90_09808 [Aphanocladium album]|nr:hypothetical protein PWT90_09808 [Aphanocladium album]
MFFFCFLVLPFVVAASASRIRTGCKTVKVGDSTDLLLKGDLLLPHGIVRNGVLLIEGGRISCVGHGCQASSGAINMISCVGSVISPGFINLHEHIAWSMVEPNKPHERYDARHDWRVGLRNHTKLHSTMNGTEIDATKWGELRHVFSGTTSIIGDAMVPGLARNLDFVGGLEDGLTARVDEYSIFPLDDAKGILRNGDCNYGPHAITKEGAGKYYRYVAHIAEGVDAEAANEFRCLSDQTFGPGPHTKRAGAGTDIIAPNLAIVHGLGLSDADYDMVARRGASVVWSPRSNVSLYGKTLNVTYLLEAGIKVALGSDWQPSGSATMAREAACGAYVTEKSYGYRIQPRTLWEMMTINAAEVGGFERHLGSLEVGKMADIAIWGVDEHQRQDQYAQVVFGNPENLELVLRGGRVLLASEELGSVAKDKCELLRFGAFTKVACVAADLNMTFAEFERVLGYPYPSILPGIPPNEPSCEPTR